LHCVLRPLCPAQGQLRFCYSSIYPWDLDPLFLEALSFPTRRSDRLFQSRGTLSRARANPENYIGPILYHTFCNQNKHKTNQTEYKVESSPKNCLVILFVIIKPINYLPNTPVEVQPLRLLFQIRWAFQIQSFWKLSEVDSAWR